MIIELSSINIASSHGEISWRGRSGISGRYHSANVCKSKANLCWRRLRQERTFLSVVFVFLLTTAGFDSSAAEADAAHKADLADGWAIQSSAKIQAPAATISSLTFTPVDWYQATVPSTVVGNLVDDMVYRDPFFGMNLRSIPGMEYQVGTNFSNKPMPAASPFKVSWWYRKEFRLTSEGDGQVWLNFDGINYRANIWLNGKLIADTNRVAGAYRTYTFNVTSTIRLREPNVLAVEVFPPDVNSLAITWVDWNPMPPDKNMGLWRDVYITATGPVALRYPHVMTKVDLPALDKAHLHCFRRARKPRRQIAEGHPQGRDREHSVRANRRTGRARRAGAWNSRPSSSPN